MVTGRNHAGTITNPEERIKKITSNLTINGGRIVHAAGRFARLS